jgi:hypothetical protein
VLVHADKSVKKNHTSFMMIPHSKALLHLSQVPMFPDMRNTKEKLHKTNAAIWFNKMCKYKQLTPKDMVIKIKGNTPQNQKTIKVATLTKTRN